MRLVVELYDPDPAGEAAYDIQTEPTDLAAIRAALDALAPALGHPIIGNVVRLDRQRSFVARTRLVPVPPEYRPGLADLLVGEPLSAPAGGRAPARPPQPAPGDPDNGTVP